MFEIAVFNSGFLFPFVCVCVFLLSLFIFRCVHFCIKLSPISLFLEMLPFIPADNLPYFEDFLSRHGLALAESGSTLSSSRSNLRNYPTSVSSITSLLPVLCFAPFKPTVI